MLEALGSTPNWVYLVFFLVLCYGVMQCFASRTKPAKLLTLPLTFLCWSAYSTATSPQEIWISAGVWLAAACAAGGIGWWLGQLASAQFHPEDGTLAIPGSIVPLAISLLFFSVSYGFGFTAATLPELTKEPAFLLSKTFATAFCTGLFSGRAAFLYFLAGSETRGSLRSRFGFKP